MRRTVGIATIISIALLAASGCAGTILLEDDFSSYRVGSDGSPLWKTLSGEWTVTQQGYLGTDCEGGFTAQGATTGRGEWRDYTVSVELKVVSRGSDWRDGPWIGVRYLGPSTAYTVGFYSRETQLHKSYAGRSTDDTNPVAASPTKIADNEWHDVSVVVEGTTVSVQLDGETIIEAVDEGANDSPPLERGGIVLAARKWENSEGSTQVLFRDLKVEAKGEVSEEMTLDPETASSEFEQISLLQFLQQRKGRRYTDVPHKVLAFYYMWYGGPENGDVWRHWGQVNADEHDAAASTHFPRDGVYDSQNPAVMARHITEAKQSGVDCFIASWWGQNAWGDRVLDELLDIAHQRDFEISVYWETAPGEGMGQVSQAVGDLYYILDKYGSHPAFLKVDGKPVIFVYGRVMGQVPMKSWPTIISETRQRYGGDFALIADGYSAQNAQVFDGIHTYNICGWVAHKEPDELRELSGKRFEGAVDTAKEHAKISCITIIPGYDDTKIRDPGINAERQDGQTYRVLWEEAIEADPDWVVITSWNEWHEGSEIEPSVEDGDQYLTITKEYAERFKSREYSEVPVPADVRQFDPEKAEKLRDIYEGTTVGILPDYGGQVPILLAETGVSLRELSWGDVVDPAVFNPQSVPVVLHAGDEDYVQSYEAEGDVDSALQGYLQQGGVLVVAAHKPFPFYYNEDGESVVSAGKFGLPMAGSGAHERRDIPERAEVSGWEEPPAGVDLAFEVNTEVLADAPPRVSFPESGDLRWRPADEALVAEEDTYLPIARLEDGEGRYYGDGIAYIEHNATEPQGGKVIYCWMRMPDILGGDEVLYSLLRLAAERAQE